jgi:hypothetical protein
MTARSLFVAMMLLCIPLASAAAEKRIALVIGNSAYQNVPHLDNPKNDAALIARTLKGLGFALIGDAAQLNLNKAALDLAVRNFGQRVQGADIALFYYAGHGVQVRGSNYLVPIDANPTREADLDFQMLDARVVLRQMEGVGPRLKLVILDACRNNPFGVRAVRGSAPGLAQMHAPEGTLISYATQPGSVAQDGADGDSPYSKALAVTIRRPGLDIWQTFNEVGLEVMRVTGGEQEPWTSTSPINGSFYLAGLAPNIVGGGQLPQTTPAEATKPSQIKAASVQTERAQAHAASVSPTGSPTEIGTVLGIVVDAAGNFYVTDGNGLGLHSTNVVRKITPAGIVTTLAGTFNEEGSADGIGEAARFNSPDSLAIDASNNIYVADPVDNTIRKITPDGLVTTLAGRAGEKGGAADGMRGLARFYSPSAIAVDHDGIVYVADNGNNMIRKITPDGLVTTWAGRRRWYMDFADGNGAAARFAQPEGLTVDRFGNVYVSDNTRVRKISPTRMVTTIAGNQRGGYGEGGFYDPKGIAVDAEGNVFVVNSGGLNKITPEGVVTTLVSNSDALRFRGLLTSDSKGNLYTADVGIASIRKIFVAGAVKISSVFPQQTEKKRVAGVVSR